MATRESLLAELRGYRAALLATIDEATPAEMQFAPEGRWSIQDLIGHLAAWQQEAMLRLRQMARGEKPTGTGTTDLDGKWSIKEILIHLSDRDRRWAEVLRRHATGDPEAEAVARHPTMEDLNRSNEAYVNAGAHWSVPLALHEFGAARGAWNQAARRPPYPHPSIWYPTVSLRDILNDTCNEGGAAVADPPTRLIHLRLPVDLLSTLDAFLQDEGSEESRTRFIQEAISERLRKERMLRALDATRGAIAAGGLPSHWSSPEKVTDWVRSIREQDREVSEWSS